MGILFTDRIKQQLIQFLVKERKQPTFPLCDFEKITYEIKLCDVLLIEGQSHVSDMIKTLTQSAWSHSILYIGRLSNIDDPSLRTKILAQYDATPNEQLVVESLLGKGTIIRPLTHHRKAHIRICRPKGLSPKDAKSVIRFAINRIGKQYGVRHVFDLMRFLLPWRILPRRLGSTLFEKVKSAPNQEICSSMLAEAFHSVRFPILPIVKSHQEKGVQFYQRNPRLYTPSDFDYSPYFEIIKYPIYELSEDSLYQKLPWNFEAILNNEEELPEKEED